MRILLALFLLFSVRCFGANLCVAVSSSGSGDGSDWNNTLGASFTASRGNTYYFADGSYGSKTFSTATSSTSLITLKKAIESDHGPSTGWNSAYGDGQATWTDVTFSTSYWVFNGQTGGGPTAWATGFGFAISGTSAVLCTLSGTITNIAISHVSLASDRGSTFIAGIKGTTGAIDSLAVSCCALTDIFGPPFFMQAWTNSNISHCYIARNKSTPADHSEGVSSIGTNTSLVWDGNWWDAIEGTAVFAGVNAGTSDLWTISNNLFTNCTTSLYYYYEADPSTNKNTLTNAGIYNNTIVGSIDVNQSIGGFNVQQGSGNVAKNNLFYAVVSNSFPWTNITHDYTWAYGNYRNGVGSKDSEIVSGEAHGVIGTADPFANSAGSIYTLNSSTTAIATGTDLSAYFTTDAAGYTRSVPWDIGAYKWLGGGSAFSGTITLAGNASLK